MSRLFLLGLILLSASATIVLKPVKSTNEKFGLIWIQGALTPAENYKPLMTEIQNQFQDSLWVGIPEFTLNTPEPITIGSKIQQALKDLQAQGLPADAKIFYGGHSLGTVMIQDYLKNNSKVPAQGLILHGGFIQRKYLSLRDDGKHESQLAVPTLSVGGELDGLSRVTRFAEALYTQQKNSVHDNSLYPIVVVPGVTHNQFASGDPSSFVKSNDLVPEVSYDQAHKSIASHTVAFMNQRIGKAAFSLDAYTQQLLQPFLDALLLEGYNMFKPPCYGHELINPTVPTCLHGSDWAAIAQVSTAGLKNTQTTVKPDANFHRVQSVAPVHLPTIKNDCDGTKPCTMESIVVVEAKYDDLISTDTGLQMLSASELKTKLVSRQNAWFHGGRKADADFDKTDSGNLCAEANQLAIDWATQHAPAKTLQRYQQYGQLMRVGSDLGPYNAGPLWIWTYMNYLEEKDQSGRDVVTVQAPMMKTPLDYSVSAAAGFHYCKILSPARVLEWMMVDGLRKQRSIKDQVTAVEQ